MRWVRLASLPETEHLWRGTLFRLRRHSNDEIIDFLLYELPGDSPSDFGLLRDSGYDAGIPVVYLPREARAKGNVAAISPTWLASNWNKWVGQEDPNAVWVNLQRRQSPENLPDE